MITADTITGVAAVYLGLRDAILAVAEYREWKISARAQRYGIFPMLVELFGFIEIPRSVVALTSGEIAGKFYMTVGLGVYLTRGVMMSAMGYFRELGGEAEMTDKGWTFFSTRALVEHYQKELNELEQEVCDPCMGAGQEILRSIVRTDSS